MKTKVLANPEAVAVAAADLFAAVVTARPHAVLALPTGRTAIPFYDELARRHAANRIHLGKALAFNLDELMLPAEHPASFASFMRRHAWERIGLDPARCDIPRAVSDREAECRRYDRALAAAGRLDVVVLGVGADGHIAYNLPGPLESSTHVVELPDDLAERLAAPPEWRPLRAITMGLGPVLEARLVLLMATGESKAAAVRALVEGPEDARWPCSLLRGHPELEVVIDRAAARDCPSLTEAVVVGEGPR